MARKPLHIPGRYITVLNNPVFRLVESYKSLRTNILFSMPYKEGACRKLLVTGANPGDGKTTTCVNIAITLAQANNRVLLIDADMRKPTVHKYFDIESRVGLSNALSGMNPLSECVKKSNNIQNLWVITSGLLPPNPSEMLSSVKMEELLTQLEQSYDYIVIDSPPINVVTDALPISKLVDGVVIVANQYITRYPDIGRAVSSLRFANANIIGFVLNKTQKVTNKRFNKNYTYSYKYKYKSSNETKNMQSKFMENLPK